MTTGWPTKGSRGATSTSRVAGPLPAPPTRVFSAATEIESAGHRYTWPPTRTRIGPRVKSPARRGAIS